MKKITAETPPDVTAGDFEELGLAAETTPRGSVAEYLRELAREGKELELTKEELPEKIRQALNWFDKKLENDPKLRELLRTEIKTLINHNIELFKAQLPITITQAVVLGTNVLLQKLWYAGIDIEPALLELSGLTKLGALTMPFLFGFVIAFTKTKYKSGESI